MGTRRVETCVASIVAARDFYFYFYFYFSPNEQQRRRGGGGRRRTFYCVLFSLFSRPRAGLATVQRSFFALATNTLNVRNNNNNNCTGKMYRYRLTTPTTLNVRNTDNNQLLVFYKQVPSRGRLPSNQSRTLSILSGCARGK